MSAEDDLSAIATTMEMRKQAVQRLHDAVAVARASGRSWATIGIFLGGISKQAARERFGP